MKRPASLGQHCRTGKSSNEKLSRLIDFFARPGRHRAREKLAGFRQQRKHLQLVEKSLRRLHIHEHADASGDLVERIDAESKLHARFGAELIDQNLRTGMALEVLEEQSRAALGAFGIATLGDAVGDFGNLKNGIGFGLDALQLAGAIERGDPLAEVVEGQRIPLCDRLRDKIIRD